MNKEKIILNLIDGTKDTRLKKIVIFQKQKNPDFNRYLIAWKVISFSGEGSKFSFPYWDSLDISVSEADGIFTLKNPVQPGFLYDAAEPYRGSGESKIQVVDKNQIDRYLLTCKSFPSQTKEIHVINSAGRGTIDLLLYRSGLLLFKWHHLLPAKKAIFNIPPVLYAAVVLPGEEFKLQEGRVMSPAVMSLPCVQFSLEELKCSDMEIIGTAPGNWAIKKRKKKRRQ
jgi:hypothetical protein